MKTVISGLLIPFVGTSAGAACVFFLKKDLKRGVQRALTGFAAGAILYVVVEKLIPEMSAGEHSNIGVMTFAIGFSLMMALDYLKAGMVIGGGMIAVFSLAVILLSTNLTGLFGQGAEVAEIVRGFFLIISIGYVLYMLTSCMQGCITGLGRPGMAMALLILYYIVIRIPAAFMLGETMGLNGIWMAFLISHVLAAVIAAIMTWYSIRWTAPCQDIRMKN